MSNANAATAATAAVAGAAADLPACPICLKRFSRKDLRDRHKRRCEKTIGKAIPTKKRACERCIASKVKCDYEKPACGRCISRSIDCEYNIEPKLRVPAASSTENPANSALRSMDFHFDLDAEMDMDLADACMPSTSVDMVDCLGEQSQPNFLSQLDAIPQQTIEPSYTWQADNLNSNGSLWNNSAIEISLAPEQHPIESMVPPTMSRNNEMNWSSSTSRNGLFSSAPQRNDSISTSTSSQFPQPSTSTVPHSLLQAPRHQAPLSAEHQALDPRLNAGTETCGNSPQSASSSSTVHSVAASPSLYSSLSEPLLGASKSRSRSARSDSIAEKFRLPFIPIHSSVAGLVSLESAISMVANYPVRMLSESFQSPFIHSKLTRQCPEGMPGPIAEALACVAMKTHSEQSGMKLVCQVFQNQRDKLIKELPTLTNQQDLVDICLSLHAMCIYQIEGLLSNTRYESRLATAVLHQEYLIRATRKLLGSTKQREATTHDVSFLVAPSYDDVSWRTWLVQESLRRTVFLIFIIHHLLGATNVLDPAYFESLFDQELMRSILLPCDDALWHAETEEEWQLARRNLENSEAHSHLTRLQQATSLVRRKGAAATEGSSASTPVVDGASQGVRGSTIQDMSEITRLIVSIAVVDIDAL